MRKTPKFPFVLKLFILFCLVESAATCNAQQYKTETEIPEHVTRP